MEPSYIEEESARLAIKYADKAADVDALCMRAHNLPASCTSEADLALFTPLIVEMRDRLTTLEVLRKEEKEPWFRRAQAVDGYFEALKKQVTDTGRRLKAIVDAWAQQKLAEERRTREHARVEAERAARERQEWLEAEAKARREAELAAARARLPERQEAHQAKVAEHAARELDAQADARAAQFAADDARIEAMRKSSDLVRTRTEEGRLVTMKQVPYVEIVDRTQLNMAALLMHLRDEDLLRALKNWAKLSAYRTPMPGAIIELRDVTEVR